jgi:hypothetical protein
MPFGRSYDAVMDVGGWLRSLGLEKYEAAFRENEIDEAVLPSRTHETLKELASQQLGIASSFSMLSLLCGAPGLSTLHPLRQHLRVRAYRPRTGPNAAKSQCCSLT